MDQKSTEAKLEPASKLDASMKLDQLLSMENVDKKHLRMVKNRIAADASRRRKREQFDEMAKRVESLESENDKYKLEIQYLRNENAFLLLKTSELENDKSQLLHLLKSTGLEFSTSVISQPKYPDAKPLVNQSTLDPLLNTMMNGMFGMESLSSNFTFPLTPSLLDDSPTLSSRCLTSLDGLISSQDGNDSDTHGMDDFIDFDQATKRGNGLGTIFTVILFSFAAFLFPSSSYQFNSFPQSSLLPTLSQPILSIPASSISSLPVYPLSRNLDTIPSLNFHPWHMSESLSISMELSLEPTQFLNALEGLADINPPNAIMGLEGLFSHVTQLHPIDIDAAFLQPTLIAGNCHTENRLIDASCVKKTTLLVQPNIRIVSYSDSALNKDDRLRVSLFANVPSSQPISGLGMKGDGGVLRLDLEVFSATWLTEPQSDY